MRTPDDTTFDRGDLLDAWLRWRAFAEAHEDLRVYHQRRWRAFRDAFGVDLSDPGRGDIVWARWLTKAISSDPELAHWAPGGRNDLHQLFERTADHLLAQATPFSQYLEMPPVVVALMRTHGRTLATAVDAVVAADTDLLIDLMEVLWGLGGAAGVDAAALRRAGFEPDGFEPDLDDYW